MAVLIKPKNLLNLWLPLHLIGNTKLSKDMHFMTSYCKSFYVYKILSGLSFERLCARVPNQLSHRAH